MTYEEAVVEAQRQANETPSDWGNMNPVYIVPRGNGWGVTRKAPFGRAIGLSSADITAARAKVGL